MLAVRNVSKVFGTDAQRYLALEGIDFEVRSGELVCLLGGAMAFFIISLIARASSGAFPDAIFSTAMRFTAVAEAYCSRHPRLLHRQMGPFSSSVTCPI